MTSKFSYVVLPRMHERKTNKVDRITFIKQNDFYLNWYLLELLGPAQK